jgi:beta-galactosidase
MFYSLMQTPYHPRYALLDMGFDPAKPLVLAGVESMSAEMQRKVADFVLAGGGLLVAPDFPRTDHDGNQCAILANSVGAPVSVVDEVDVRRHPVCVAEGVRVFGLRPKKRFVAPLPTGARATLLSEDGADVYGCRWECGAGRVSQFGATWTAQFFLQAEMAGRLVAWLGAKPVAASLNRNVFVTAYRLKDGGTGVFALNLHSSPQTTVVTLPSGATREFRLGAMEVGYATPLCR